MWLLILIFLVVPQYEVVIIKTLQFLRETKFSCCPTYAHLTRRNIETKCACKVRNYRQPYLAWHGKMSQQFHLEYCLDFRLAMTVSDSTSHELSPMHLYTYKSRHEFLKCFFLYLLQFIVEMSSPGLTNQLSIAELSLQAQ